MAKLKKVIKRKPEIIRVRILKKKVLAGKEKITPRIGTNFAFKIAALLLIVISTWNGLSTVYQTTAYMSDTENSVDNNFTAGILDFELSSTQVFSNMILSPGSSVTGTISVINLDNIPKYKLKAVGFSGALCDYLNLDANLDGGDVEYSGKLTDIDFGPTVFESPDDWFFTLTLPIGTTEDIIGETCNFNFVFYGSQIRNDLPFGQGFTDEENADNNVKAKICFDSETRSKGYWKNDLDVAKPYLPQMLGNEFVNNTADVYRILHTEYSSSTINKLEAQLLTMKLNVAHFGMGDYIPSGTSNTVNQIIIEADNLLKETPTPEDSILEQMKDLLDGLNHDLQIIACTETGVKVLVPNGGEKWWVGKYYDLTWMTKNLNCPNDLAQISIWYSKDSGTTWGNIATSEQDDGVYNWRIPLFLEGTYYTPSDKARIKVVAVCSDTLMVAGWDMSDADFCPPIDFELLTDEEKVQVEQLLADGILTEAEIINREIPASAGGGEELSETPVIEGAAVTQDIPVETIEEITTTTEEITTTTEETGIIDQIVEVINNIVDEIVGVILPDEIIEQETIIEETPIIEEELIVEEPIVEENTVEEQIIEEPVIEELPIVEETPVIEESIIEEPLVVEEAPVIEETPVVAPENIVVEVAPSEPTPADTGVTE